MRRRSLILPGLVALVLLAPAIAYATEYELGQTKSPIVAPTCPSNLPSSQCTIILTRVTALETLRDRVSYPTKVKVAGRIVAFTVGLSALSSNANTRKSYISYLDHTYGGATQVGITVLKPVGKRGQWRWQVVAASPMYYVEPYLGEVVQIPLESSIPVRSGEVVALTTPTWAPVLTIDVPSKQFAYRQSRSRNCNNPPGSSQAQVSPRQTATYSCDYPGTRVEYSASEIGYPGGKAPSSSATTTTTTTTKTRTTKTKTKKGK